MKKGYSMMPPPTGPGTALGLGILSRACTAAATRAISALEYLHLRPSMYSETINPMRPDVNAR